MSEGESKVETKVEGKVERKTERKTEGKVERKVETKVERKVEGKEIRCNLVLDLDQTLISAEPTEEYDFERYGVKASKFDFHNMDDYYIVFERPGLQDFLDYAFANFNVSVWTAASKDYALFIINKIVLQKPGRTLDWIFFSYHCKFSEKCRDASKSLEMLWDVYQIPGYSNRTTIILDDYDEVIDTQPKNAILADEFQFTKRGSEGDNFLQRVREKLERVKNMCQTGELGTVVLK